MSNYVKTGYNKSNNCVIIFRKRVAFCKYFCYNAYTNLCKGESAS